MESLFSLENALAIIILIFSAILHEIAHGYVADRLGDPTARLMGRLTLDPRPHIDPFFTILMPLLLIFSGSTFILGGAKPVPVDPFNLKDGKKDMALVSLAGPLMNIVLAITGALLIHILYSGVPFVLVGTSLFGLILTKIVILNLLLAVFNLLPIPPLDGSKIFALLLPEREAHSYLSIGPVGILIIIFLFMVPLGPFSLSGLIGSILSFSLSLLGF